MRETLSYELVRRRIGSALSRIFDAHPSRASHGHLRPGVGRATQNGWRTRVNAFVVEGALARLNLTSYKNLLRTRTRLVQVAEERARSSQELADANAVVARLRADVDSLLLERSGLRLDLEAAIEARDRTLSERTALTAERGRLVEEMARASADRLRLAQQSDLARVVKESAAAMGGQVHEVRARLAAIANQLQRDPTAVDSRVSTSPNDPLFERLRRFDAIRGELTQGAVLPLVRASLEQHYASEGDPNLAAIWGEYDEAHAKLLAYWDVRSAVRVLARHLDPRTYLEVGTRRGWSLAQLFTECPSAKAFVFELWEPNYGGTQQGSPEYVRAKMEEVVGSGRSVDVTFITGNSHDTLTEFLTGPNVDPDQRFDVVTIDGDHSRLGAWWDLCDLFPRIAVGGALVFDDLEYAGDEEIGVPPPSSQYDHPPLPPGLYSLQDVWVQMQVRYPNFLFLSAPNLKFRAGIAFRLA